MYYLFATKFQLQGGGALGEKFNKAILRLKSVPADYTYTEAKRLMRHLGFEEYNKGKTSGSRVSFVKESKKIMLHKPHPGDEMNRCAVRQLKEYLEGVGEI